MAKNELMVKLIIYLEMNPKCNIDFMNTQAQPDGH